MQMKIDQRTIYFLCISTEYCTRLFLSHLKTKYMDHLKKIFFGLLKSYTKSFPPILGLKHLPEPLHS